MAATASLEEKLLLPQSRSAYCLLPWTSELEEEFLVLSGGDTGLACERLDDLWLLDAKGALQGRMAWMPITTTRDYSQARSNHGAAIVGKKLFVFGGWDNAGTNPLAALSILDLVTLAWLEADSVRGSPPSPRGQPGMLSLSDGQTLAVFGGWNGKQHFDDLHLLDTELLEWSEITSADDFISVRPSSPGVVPQARADHSCSKWRYCDDGVWKDLLVCFGGSSAGGVRNDVWLFDFRWRKWTQAFCAGQAPSPRSSHASEVVGDALITVGGQRQGEVFSDCHVLHLVSLSWRQVEIPGLGPICRHSLVSCTGMLWTLGGFNGLTTLSQTYAIAPGGLLGDKAQGGAEDLVLADSSPAASPADHAKETFPQSLFQRARLLFWGSRTAPPASSQPSLESAIPVVEAVVGGHSRPDREFAPNQAQTRDVPAAGPGEGAAAMARLNAELKRLQLKGGASSSASETRESSQSEVETPEALWGSKPKPFTVADLSPEDRRLKGWRLLKRLHEAAVQNERDTYVDPPSGYTVFTAWYLKQRPCCGNKCRHCPWAYANVQKDGDQNQIQDW